MTPRLRLRALAVMLLAALLRRARSRPDEERQRHGNAVVQLQNSIWLTIVTAGFPRTTAASPALSELFAERRASPNERGPAS